MSDYNNPREEGRAAIRATVKADLWEQNERFTQKLESILAKHPLATHPIKEFFENETIDEQRSLKLHLEFGVGFAQIFTDAVLQAMAKATQLEGRLGPRAKVTARFLWAINLQDELGFFPSGSKEHYCGHPDGAHYYQYVKMFKDMGGTEAQVVEYQASAETIEARKTFEDNYNDYTVLCTVLALSESIFDQFAGAWADNVGRSTNVNISEGYHTIHVEDDHGDSIDDEHSEDGWTLVRQAMTPERYEEVEAKAKLWLDAWYKFADKMMEIAVS